MSVLINLARDLCRKYPDLPTRSLARKFFTKNKDFIRSEEHARDYIRRARGAAGVKDREHAKEVIPRGEASSEPSIYDGIPIGCRQGKPPFILPLPAKVLVMSDMHVPYHCEKAIEVALKTGVDEKCDTIYLNGDSIDFYQISRFVKDPRNRTPKQEVDTLTDILKVFSKSFKRKYYKCGNHDERWEIALHTQAPHLAAFEQFELPEILGLKKDGWGYVASKQRSEFGQLHVIHGHEATRGLATPVNPARGIWLRIKATCLAGHWHQSSQHTESMPLDKRIVASWSTGALCDLNPEFASINAWNHGFAIVEIDSNRDFKCRNFRIIEGKAYPA